MSQAEPPIAALKAEHQIILRVIRVLGGLVNSFEANGEFLGSALERCVEFLRLFADACHHGKEEDLLFPILESRGIPRDGGPIGVMLYEHKVARQLTRDMHDALARCRAGETTARAIFCQAARGYIDLLTNHIFKEDNILFNIGARLMDAGDQTKLATQFCAVNCRVFEGKRREQLQQMAHDLESECSS